MNILFLFSMIIGIGLVPVVLFISYIDYLINHKEQIELKTKKVNNMKKSVIEILRTITIDDIQNILIEKYGKQLPTENSFKDLNEIISNVDILLFHLKLEREKSSFELWKNDKNSDSFN